MLFFVYDENILKKICRSNRKQNSMLTIALLRKEVETMPAILVSIRRGILVWRSLLE